MKRYEETLERAALVGTERASIEDDLPPYLADIGRKILSNDSSKEGKFLKLAACVYQYKNAGILPKSEEIHITATPEEEEGALLPESSARLLDRCIAENEIALLKDTIDRCLTHRFVAPHSLLPALLELGLRQRRDEELGALLRTFIGARGHWLSQFDPAWFDLYCIGSEKLWHEASLPLRIRSLDTIRKADRQKGLALLQATWNDEHYKTRLAFLNALSSTIALDDAPFLMGCLEDKSKEVQREALRYSFTSRHHGRSRSTSE